MIALLLFVVLPILELFVMIQVAQAIGFWKMLLFLLLLSLSGIKILGAVAPIGGVCFLAGWTCLAIAAWRS